MENRVNVEAILSRHTTDLSTARSLEEHLSMIYQVVREAIVLMPARGRAVPVYMYSEIMLKSYLTSLVLRA